MGVYIWDLLMRMTLAWILLPNRFGKSRWCWLFRPAILLLCVQERAS